MAEKPVLVKSTPRQKRLARKIVEVAAASYPITGAELVASVGYSPAYQRNPGGVMKAPGVQAELEILGFTVQKAKEVVGVILSDTGEKADSRLKAAEMVFKAFGTYAPERSLNINMSFKPDARSIELASEFEAKLKGELN